MKIVIKRLVLTDQGFKIFEGASAYCNYIESEDHAVSLQKNAR